MYITKFQILVRPHNNSDVLFPLSQLLVPVCSVLCAAYLFLFLQVTVIKNLAEEEKKDTKAFLKQQPFAKPGDIYSTYIYIYTNP